MWTSIKNRVKGVFLGMGMGLLVPVIAPIAIPFMFTGNTGGSGAGPAFAMFAGAMVVIIGGVLVVLSLAGGAALQLFGMPWWVTAAAIYLGVWGLLGATVFRPGQVRKTNNA